MSDRPSAPHADLIRLLRPFEDPSKWTWFNRHVDAFLGLTSARIPSTDGPALAENKRATLETVEKLKRFQAEYDAARSALEKEAPKLRRYLLPLGQWGGFNVREKAETVATLIGELLSDVPIYVDLDQMAASVGRRKASLEKLKTRKINPLPHPDIPGGGGAKDEWEWSRIRPWLENEFVRQLPHTPRRLL